MEEYEIIEYDGFCYSGQQEYEQFLKEKKPGIVFIAVPPETIQIGFQMRNFPIKFISTLDQDFFNQDKYRVYIQLSKFTRLNEPDSKSQPRSYTYSSNLNFDILADPKVLSVETFEDTLTSSLYYGINSSSFPYSHFNDFPDRDTVTFCVHFSLCRLVNQTCCSKAVIDSTEIITAIINRKK
jgi:hypothetical protein